MLHGNLIVVPGVINHYQDDKRNFVVIVIVGFTIIVGEQMPKGNYLKWPLGSSGVLVMRSRRKGDEMKYNLLPEHIRRGVKNYIERGIIPGDFLQAVICNNLKESFNRADDINITRMLDIVDFFYNEAPFLCWGSEEKMYKWIERHRSNNEDFQQEKARAEGE